jgi:proteasome lid subunit RPN8/RPN11
MIKVNLKCSAVFDTVEEANAWIKWRSQDNSLISFSAERDLKLHLSQVIPEVIFKGKKEILAIFFIGLDDSVPISSWLKQGDESSVDVTDEDCSEILSIHADACIAGVESAVIVHNHPDGSIEDSLADIRLYSRLVALLPGVTVYTSVYSCGRFNPFKTVGGKK